jgi:hypothetical protein
LATGDFNWDGYDDLVIGVPRESLIASEQPQQWAKLETGAVNVIYGSSIGLTALGSQFIEEEWCEGEFDDNDHFGASLAVGDFDQDGYMDLAVGTPNKYNEHAGGSGSTIGKEAGAFYVICGSAVGFEWSGRCRMWYADDMAPGGVTDGVAMGGTAFEFDHFGAALSTGDFDGDWCCDLAIGKPGQSIFHRAGPPPYWYSDAGTVDVMYGSETGLWTVNGKTWHQNMAGIKGASEDYDGFGSSLPGSHWLESYL